MQFDGVALQNDSVVMHNVCVEMQNDSVEDEHQRQSINNKFAHIKKWKMGSLFLYLQSVFLNLSSKKYKNYFFCLEIGDKVKAKKLRCGDLIRVILCTIWSLEFEFQ